MSKKAGKKEEAAPAAAAKKEEPKKVAEVEEKKVEAKSAKAEKPKAEKKKKEEKGAHALYKIDGDKATRLRPTCERCGTGYFMADHHDRYTCGHCGFTRYKQSGK
jgi:small subunit ribosomal protein S27Ae